MASRAKRLIKKYQRSVAQLTVRLALPYAPPEPRLASDAAILREREGADDEGAAAPLASARPALPPEVAERERAAVAAALAELPKSRREEAARCVVVIREYPLDPATFPRDEPRAPAPGALAAPGGPSRGVALDEDPDGFEDPPTVAGSSPASREPERTSPGAPLAAGPVLLGTGLDNFEARVRQLEDAPPARPAGSTGTDSLPVPAGPVLSADARPPRVPSVAGSVGAAGGRASSPEAPWDAECTCPPLPRGCLPTLGADHVLGCAYRRWQERESYAALGLPVRYATSSYSPEAFARIREAEAIEQAALDRESGRPSWLSSRDWLGSSPKEREAFRWKEIARRHAEAQAAEKDRAVERLRELKADMETMRDEFGGNDPVTAEAERRYAEALAALTKDEPEEEPPGASTAMRPEDLL